MGRFLGIWRRNLLAPWPTNPVEALKLNEKMWAVMDGLIAKGTVKEIAWFMEGHSGYVIAEGSSAEILENVSMFSPYIQVEVHEAINFERAREIFRKVYTVKAEATK